ncbi:PKD domain-containing protein, partial [Candidatus Woesearchaeota archaeon]|nr:PKD domain-containing protein [Candidatus Woesearchaeota archaeon]
QITLPQTQVNLDGTVTDDGKPIPPGKVTTTWEKRSGPGTVTFGNKNSEKTTATFSDVGDYVLRLTADDGPGVGSLQSFDEMKVTVLSGGLTVCGNGKKEGLEECEFDPLTGEPLPENCDYQPKLFRCTTKDTGTTKGCRCVPNDPKNCGDGLRSDNEECDVGNANWGTQGTCGMGKVCSAGCVCQPSTDYCGDGTISTFPGREQCDFMAPGNGGCPATKYCTRWCSCRPKYGLGWCGDGKYQAGFEECEPNVVGCMDIPGKILLGCRADCRCDYRDTTPPDRPDPEGNPRQKCEPTQFCLYASCAGDCPPAESCGASGSTCGCVKDVAQPRPCLRSGGTACNPDGSCKTGYQCDKLSNCCEPLTGIIG